jgi:glycosyltransferase involved in cell wall biosynthesis
MCDIISILEKRTLVALRGMTMTDEIKISACIITYNEADMIAECLASVSWADEIVVVDSGSGDGTVESAEARGCRVIHQDFLGHVKQKDLAVREAQNRWVFCLDADERLAEGGESVIRKVLAEDGEKVAGYFFPRRTFYLGGWVDHGGWWPEYRLRLFDRERGWWEGVDPHDHVRVDGSTRRIDALITHYNYRDIAHHLEKVNAYTSTMAGRKNGAGEKASVAKMVFNPLGRFFRMYVLKQGFRDGVRGFVIAAIGGFYVFLKYAKLWEMQRIPAARRKGEEGG